MAAVDKLGLVGSVTVAGVIAALPVFVPAAADATAPAAAIFDGSVKATLRLDAVCAVGCIRKVSPAAGVPESTMEMPSAVRGLPAVPAPVKATLVPSLAFARAYAPFL